MQSVREYWSHKKKSRIAWTVLWGARSGLASGTVLPALHHGNGGAGAVSAGDFNGDGHQDLFRGAGPGEEGGRVEFGPFGRDGRPASVQDDGALLDADPDVELRHVLSGDVDGDGRADLVTIVRASQPNGDEDWPVHANLIRGSRDGLRPLVRLRDAKGRSLWPASAGAALGDINGDGRADLVTGYQRLTVHLGTEDGLDTASRQRIDQDTPGVPGTDKAFSCFACSLAIGDVNGDGHGDIVAGSPEADIGKFKQAGRFTVIPGGLNGPNASAALTISQHTPGVPGTPRPGGMFGYAIHLIDSNADGLAEPAVSTWQHEHANGAWIFPTHSSGVVPHGSLSIDPRVLGPAGANTHISTAPFSSSP